MTKYNAQNFLSHGRNLNLTYKFEALSGELLYQNLPHIYHEIWKILLEIRVEIHLHPQMCLSPRRL